MILTDYYKGEKLTDAKSRFDIVASKGEYDFFEIVIKRKNLLKIKNIAKAVELLTL